MGDYKAQGATANASAGDGGTGSAAPGNGGCALLGSSAWQGSDEYPGGAGAGCGGHSSRLAAILASVLSQHSRGRVLHADAEVGTAACDVQGVRGEKVYPAVQPWLAPWSSSWNIATSAVRAVAHALRPGLAAWSLEVKNLYEEDDAERVLGLRPADEELPPLPPLGHHLVDIPRGIGEAICLDLATYSVRGTFEWLTKSLLSPQLAWKMTKDVCKSAARKAARTGGGRQLRVALDILPTAARAHALTVATELSVTQYQRCVMGLVLLHSRGYLAQGRAGPHLRVCARVALRNVLVAAGRLVGLTIGAGAGTYLQAGRGTLVGQTLGGYVFANLVDMLLTLRGLPSSVLPPPPGPSPKRRTKSRR